MAVYQIQAPDGNTYSVTGPDGATQAQVQAEVLRQNPQAGSPKAAQAASQPPSFLDHALGVLKGVASQNSPGATLEPLAHLASGVIAQPVAGIAGLGAMAGNALGMHNDPASVVNNTQNALTYQSRGDQAKQTQGAMDSILGIPGQLADKAGQGVSDATGSPALGAATNTALQGAAMLAGGKALKALAPADLPAAPKPVTPALAKQTLSDANKAGIMVTPEYSASSGGSGGGATGTVASLSGSEVKLQQSFSKYNSRVALPKIAGQDIGLDPSVPLTPSALDDLSTKANNVYTAASKVGDFTPDAQLVADMKKIGVRNQAVDDQFGSSAGPQIQALQDRYSPKQNPGYQGPQTDLVNATGEPTGAAGMPPAPILPYRGTLSAADPRASVIGQSDLFQLQNPPRPGIVQQGEMIGAGRGRSPSQGPLGQQTDLLGTSQDTSPSNPYQPMNAEALIQATRDLRADARSLYKQTENPEALRMADATRKAGDALDDFVQRQLQQKGLSNLADAYANARVQKAKIASVRDALNPATGSIDGTSLAKDLDNGVPLSGGLKTIAMSAKAYPKVMQVPERLPASSGPTVLEQGGAVAALLHGNVPAALAMFARPLARARVGTQGFQNRMVNPSPPSGPTLPGPIAASPLSQPIVSNQGAQQQPGQP